jgi:hypothetical protein
MRASVAEAVRARRLTPTAPRASGGPMRRAAPCDRRHSEPCARSGTLGTGARHRHPAYEKAGGSGRCTGALEGSAFLLPSERRLLHAECSPVASPAPDERGSRTPGCGTGGPCEGHRRWGRSRTRRPIDGRAPCAVPSSGIRRTHAGPVTRSTTSSHLRACRPSPKSAYLRPSSEPHFGGQAGDVSASPGASFLSIGGRHARLG